MLLNPESSEKIKSVKRKIMAAIEERNELEAKDSKTKGRSVYWTHFSDKFGYLFGLEEKFFGELRYHTFHLDADRYEEYFYGWHKDSFQKEWEALIADIPEKYLLSAPEHAGKMAYDFGGRMVDDAVLRFQQSIRTLWKAGVLEDLERKSAERKINILEIGAGYGAMAYHLMTLLPNSRYFILDIPETLLFSSSYLTLGFPHKKIYIYEHADFEEKLRDKFAGYDIVILPNFVAGRLRAMRFDLAVNVQSFQEMRPEQVDEYAALLADTLDGKLYSWNIDAQPQNKEGVNVTAQLSRLFNLKELHWTTVSRSAWSRLPDISPRKLWKRLTRQTPPYVDVREYVATKK